MIKEEMKDKTLPWHVCRWDKDSIEKHLRFRFQTLLDEDLIRMSPSAKTIKILATSRKLNKYILKWIESVYGKGAWSSNLCEFEKFPIKNRKLYNAICEDIERIVESDERYYEELSE